MQATIFDIKPFSIHDGPGIRTTVFFKGCPLTCAWCHNPEGISTAPQVVWHAERCIGCGECVAVCPAGALSMDPHPVQDASMCVNCWSCTMACPTEAWEKIGRLVSVEELLKESLRDRPFFEESGGGITCSGGEPLLQADFVAEYFSALGDLGIHRTLDTSGLAPSNQLAALLPQTDLFLFDLKMMDPASHQAWTGVSNDLILKNLLLLNETESEVVIRIPIIPSVNNTEENITQLITFLREKTRFRRVDLLPYHQTAQTKYERLNLTYRLAAIQPEEGISLVKVFTHAGFQVQLGG